jgi:hypothetical protein
MLEKKGLKAPTYLKTGTTIVGLVFQVWLIMLLITVVCFLCHFLKYLFTHLLASISWALELGSSLEWCIESLNVKALDWPLEWLEIYFVIFSSWFSEDSLCVTRNPCKQILEVKLIWVFVVRRI